MIVIQYFIDVLFELGVEGFETYLVDLEGRDRERIPAPRYIGFVSDLSGESEVHVVRRGGALFRCHAWARATWLV